jgi:hypothetical protein
VIQDVFQNPQGNVMQPMNQASAPSAADIFSGSAPAMQEPAQPEKPKFQPNPMPQQNMMQAQM